MSSLAFSIFGSILYACAAGLLWRGLRQNTTGAARVGIFALIGGALVLHAAVLYTHTFRMDGLDLGLTNALSLVGWVIALLFVITATRRPIESLGVLILPIAAAMLLLTGLWPGTHTARIHASPLMSTHIVISLLAYSLLSIAVIQSLMLAVQEKALRQHHPGQLMRALPPLETMEGLMFWMLGLGFVLLTLTLISGVFFSEALFGQPLRLTHHTVLSMLAWGIFGILLIGHWRFGWRGRTALRWTLTGFILLVLAYFGSKFVLEVLLKR